MNSIVGYRNLIFLALAVASSASVSVAKEPSLDSTMLRDKVAWLESEWKAGSGRLQYDYYVGARDIGNDLFGFDQNVGNPVALTLLRNVLAKSSRDSNEIRHSEFDVGSADLEAIRTIARYLLDHDVVPAAIQNDKVAALAIVLGRIRGELQPDYVEKRVYENVMPPEGEGIRIAGMSPESIADAGAREEYREAIRQNQLNSLSNKRQRALGQMEQELAIPIVEYLARIAATGSNGLKVVRDSALVARLTPAERVRILGPQDPP